VNPTLIGMLAVFVWGASLPINRLIQEQIGLLASVGIIFTGAALLSLLWQCLRKTPWPDKAIFSNPLLYVRWICFVLHEALILSAISIVQRQHMPFVILLNYLWPTAIIVFSVLIAGVKISRPWAFLLGSLVVIGSLALEIVDPQAISTQIFASKTDCLAYVFAVVGAISWGLYCAFTRRSGESTGGGTVVPFFQLTFGLALIPCFLPSYSVPWTLSTLGAIFLLGYSFLQFVAYLAWDFGMRKGNVVLLSLGADFIPWLSLASATFIIEVSISTITCISAATLVAGAMITRYGTLQKRTI